MSLSASHGGVDSGTRWLIVNADDFGRSAGINRGVALSHERGIVTSASLMVRWPAAVEAAAYAREHLRLGLGLHVDFGEWRWRARRWDAVYDAGSGTEPARIVAEQIDRFRDLVGRDPSHLDSHQHAHHREPFRPALVALARELGVPLRGHDPRVRSRGDFYGQTRTGSPMPAAIGVDALLGILDSLRSGCTELVCHPGLGSDLDSDYARERSCEVRSLCHPRVRARVSRSGIRLCTFLDLASQEVSP